jgi:hypothetical protein
MEELQLPAELFVIHHFVKDMLILNVEAKLSIRLLIFSIILSLVATFLDNPSISLD